MAVYSEPLYSDPVVLITAPAAPTLAGIYAARVGYFDVSDEDIVLQWVHNALDGTAQTKYELSYRIDGGAWTSSGEVVSTSSQYDLIDEQNGVLYEWYVRTWGQSEDASPWSAIGSFRTSVKPVCAITSPEEPVGSWRQWPSPGVAVTHTFSDTEGGSQTYHRTELWDESDSTLLWFSEQAGTSLSSSIDYTLANGSGTFDGGTGTWSVPSRYIIKKKVKDSDGLWSLYDTVPLEVVWETPPAIPDPPTGLTVIYDGTEATIDYDVPTSATGVDNPWTHARIDRWSNDTGSWEIAIAEIAPGDEPGIDATVVDNRQYLYRVVAEKTAVSYAGPLMRATSTVVTNTEYTYTTPSPPANFTATQPEEYVQISWTNECTYPARVHVQRKNLSLIGSPWVDIITVDAAQESIPDITTFDDTEYSYQARTEYSPALYSAWVEIASSITTSSNTIPSVYSINIPPVRRNGPRESEKENIESAEFSSIVKLIEEKLTWLTDTIEDVMTVLEVSVDQDYAGMESATAKTEIE